MGRTTALRSFIVFAVLLIVVNVATGLRARPLALIERAPWLRVLVLPAVYGRELFFTIQRTAEKYLAATRQFERAETLAVENERLRTELMLLRKRLDSVEALSGLAALRSKFPFDLVPCNVIGRNPQFWFRHIMITGGTDQRFAPGMPVITRDGLIGKISAVFPSTSQVLLLNDPTFSVDVRGERSGILALASGTGSSLLKLNFVPKFEEPVVGELLTTSGFDSAFPEGIPVGHIVESFKPFTDYFLEAHIIPVADALKVRNVMVIRGE